jgi:hypothetical protein
MNNLVVTPVIELGINTVAPPLNTSGGRLAAELQRIASAAGYLESPDGWFIPLGALMDKIEAVADYLHSEILHYNEFELFGGFEIVKGKYSVGISLGANFRFAMELAEAIDSLSQENETRRVFIDNDRYLNLVLEKGSVKITTGHSAKLTLQVELVVPVEELKQQMKTAQDDVDQFARAIEPFLVHFPDTHISPKAVRQMFGLASEQK